MSLRHCTLAVVATIALTALLISGCGEPEPNAPVPASSDGQWYISQMHPWIVQPEPGTCPICGMDLVPVDPDRFAGEIAIDPRMTQNMGIRVATAESAPLARSVRTVATLAADETRTAHVHIKVAGWIDTALVTWVGQPVHRGDVLFTIDAPDLYAAQQELQLARRAVASGRADGERLRDAAERRLRYLGGDDELLTHLAEGGEPRELVEIHSPVGGTVLAVRVSNGTQVTPGLHAYEIADLSTLWAWLTIYEHQLPLVNLGATVDLSIDGIGEDLRGTIDFIDPSVEPATRTVRARVTLANAAGKLKPGMFATATIVQVSSDPQILIPAESVLDSGERKLVFVHLGKGRFEPRTVETGERSSDGRIAITRGIEAGERVVSSGQFLLDSEARLRESIAKLMRGDLADGPSDAVTATDPASPLADATHSEHIMQAYLTVQEALYLDNLAGARGAIDMLGAHLEQPAVAALVAAADIKAARTAFGDLGIFLRDELRAHGAPASMTTLTLQHCGMYKDAAEGGIWIQRGDDTRNPFFGHEHGMSECASESEALAARKGSK